jgi:cysteine synthase B
MDTISIDEQLLERAKAIRSKVGDTPLIRLDKLFTKKNVEVYAKQEWKQLSGSVKCRPAYFIILNAIQEGALNRDRSLLDATSGNTGIAYAAIGAELGIKVTLCLPENASKERKEILESLGAELIYTSRHEGTDGAQDIARELAQLHPDKYFYADQYKNDQNWKAHYHTTAMEIFSKVPGITHFVAGLGTSGTFVGTGRRLRELKTDIRLISLQPDSAMHALEGWKHMETAMVPAIYDPGVADENREVRTEAAYEYVKLALEKESLQLSPSSGANLAGVAKLVDEIEQGVIVTMLPDNADKYSEIIKKII